MLNEPKFVDIKSKNLRILLGNLRRSSENVRKRSYYPRTAFGKSLEIFGKWSEILLLVLVQNNTWLLGDMKFLFSCSNRYLFEEQRTRVLFSISPATPCQGNRQNFQNVYGFYGHSPPRFFSCLCLRLWWRLSGKDKIRALLRRLTRSRRGVEENA